MDFFVLTPSLSLDIKSLADQLNRPDVTIECMVLDSHEEHYYIRKKGKLICEYLKRKHGPSLNEHTIAISFRNKKHRKLENNNTPKLNDLCGPVKKQELCELTKQIESTYKLHYKQITNNEKNH